MNKLSKEKRSKLLLVAVGTGATLLALYLMVISAQQSSLKDLADKTDAAREKLAKAELWLRMAPQIQAKLETRRTELEASHDQMVPVDKYRWFYNTLDQFVAKYRVKLIDITREPELGEAGLLPNFPYQAATFGVKLAARFHDFGTFLADFENQFPLMRVQNLEIQPDSESRTGLKGPATSNSRAPSPETLAITLRVVTLVKPSTPL